MTCAEAMDEIPFSTFSEFCASAVQNTHKAYGGKNMPKTVFLVYSGGLDTSVCIPMMREDYGFDHVVTVTVNVGLPAGELKQAEDKARLLGTEHYTIDARAEFVTDYIFPTIKANGDYQGYPDQHVDRAASDCHEGCRGRQAARYRCVLPRLHRQGQRSVQVRVRIPHVHARHPDHRPHARAHNDPLVGDRIR